MRLDLSLAERRQLMDVALGKVAADLIVQGVRLVNVYTGEVLDNQVVACKSGRIGYVGPPIELHAASDTKVVDGEGQFLVPGLIEGHTHLIAYYGIEEFQRYALPGGTTTVITEVTEIAAVLGLQGVIAELAALADQPMRFFATLPPLAMLAPYMESLTPEIEEYRALLQRDDVAGLGEVYWGNLVNGDDRLLERVHETLKAGKLVEGHAAGARGQKLQSFAASGISSCHEPITAEEGLQRLRLGMHWMAREGEIRRDLDELCRIWREQKIDLRRLIVVTDSVGPRRLLEQGYLDHNLRRAIQLGLDPIKAVQTMTLNVAEHFRLDQLLGGLAPGRFADMWLTEDLQNPRASLVICDGRLVARCGKLLVEPRPAEYPPPCMVSVHRPRPLRPDDFHIIADGRQRARMRAIQQVTHLVTREVAVEGDAVDGRFRADPSQDVLKASAIRREGRSSELFTGLVKGFGLRNGAIATSMTWDSQDLVVVGSNDRDMAMAADRLIDMQGGVAVFADGKLLAEFAAPIAGLRSPAPMPEIAEAVDGVLEACHGLGCRLEDPILACNTMTTACIPWLRITERGYVRVKDLTEVGLWLD